MRPSLSVDDPITNTNVDTISTVGKKYIFKRETYIVCCVDISFQYVSMLHHHVHVDIVVYIRWILDILVI